MRIDLKRSRSSKTCHGFFFNTGLRETVGCASWTSFFLSLSGKQQLDGAIGALFFFTTGGTRRVSTGMKRGNRGGSASGRWGAWGLEEGPTWIEGETLYSETGLSYCFFFQEESNSLLGSKPSFFFEGETLYSETGSIKTTMMKQQRFFFILAFVKRWAVPLGPVFFLFIWGTRWGYQRANCRGGGRMWRALHLSRQGLEFNLEVPSRQGQSGHLLLPKWQVGKSDQIHIGMFTC